MSDRNDNIQDDDDFDLSEMINEYENDNSLRNKIEALKQEKMLQEQKILEETAELEKKLEEEKKHSALYTGTAKHEETQDIPVTGKTVSMNIIDFDEEEVEKTMIANPESNEFDVNKTLVIMDNQKQKSFHGLNESNDTTSTYTFDDVESNEESLEFADDEDLEEFIPEKEEKKKMDPEKRNKIITYVCIGAAVVCVIGLLIFGWFIFQPADSEEKKEDDKTVETDKDKDKDKDKDSETNNTNNTTNNNQNVSDNTEEINRLNAEIASYETQLTTATNNYNSATTDYNNATVNLSNAETTRNNAQSAYDSAKSNYDLNKDPDKKKDLEDKMNKAKSALDAAISNYDAVKKAQSDALDRQTNYGNDISRINTELTSLRNQLNSLK